MNCEDGYGDMVSMTSDGRTEGDQANGTAGFAAASSRFAFPQRAYYEKRRAVSLLYVSLLHFATVANLQCPILEMFCP